MATNGPTPERNGEHSACQESWAFSKEGPWSLSWNLEPTLHLKPFCQLQMVIPVVIIP